MRHHLTILCLLAALVCSAQNKKAFVEINNTLQKGELENAATMLERQIKKEKKVGYWYTLLDDTYKCLDMTGKRISMLKGALEVKDVSDYANIKYRYALALFDAGEYDSSLSILKTFKQNKTIKHAEENCIKAKELKANPIDVSIVSMGDSVNTPYDNIWPLINTDKNLFYTTVVVGKNSVAVKSFDIQEDIFCSALKDSVWMPAYVLQGELRSSDNEGACTITADGMTLFFAACNRKGGKGGCEIYYSKQTNGKWGVPQPCQSPMNSFRWQSTPSISADGKTLYFSAIDASSKQPADKNIYYCKVSYDKKGTPSFSEVTKMGEEINTDYNEISPFISPYDSILYFASEGHGGMGGLDIFYSRRQKDGTWSKAVNLGYPVNTFRDEFGFSSDADGKYGYMSCNGIEGGEFWPNKRIVRIELPEEHSTNALFESLGDDFTLDNIYFDTDSSRLKESSFAALDEFVKFLTIHPSYKVFISGHTDNTGSEQHNIELSLARAGSVAKYLIAKGVSQSRIKCGGFGSAKPVADNNTVEGQALNRRIEVQIERD